MIVFGRNSVKGKLDPEAVSSSNLILVGGPYANVLTEYVNEFSMLFLNGSSMMCLGYLSLTCWRMDYYPAATAGGGYASVSIYRDINGTTISVYLRLDCR